MHHGHSLASFEKGRDTEDKQKNELKSWQSPTENGREEKITKKKKDLPT